MRSDSNRDEFSKQPPATDMSDWALAVLSNALLVFCAVMLAIAVAGPFIGGILH